MRADLISEMYHQEKYYWWHQTKQNLVLALIKKYSLKTYGLRILDLGCGTGLMMKKMSAFGFVLGTDNSDLSRDFSHRNNPGLKITNTDLEKPLPFSNEEFDIVTLLDTLEHVKNDKSLLLEAARILKKGGILIITVPSYQILFSYWDKILGHFRRYNCQALQSRLSPSFKILKISYFHIFAFLPAIVFRFCKTILPTRGFSTDFIKLPRFLNLALIKIGNMEIFTIDKLDLPFGLSLFCVARKK